METTQTAPETTQTPAAPETEPSPLWTGPKKRRKWIKRVLVIAAVLALLFWIVIRPMLGGMATALLDETIQLYVPGRTSSVRDVWIDFGGVIAGLFVALLLLLIVRGLTSFHAMKKENRRLRAERAELLRQQRADRINTADDRPESPDRREYL